MLFHHLLFKGADIWIYVVIFMDFLIFSGQLTVFTCCGLFTFSGLLSLFWNCLTFVVVHPMGFNLTKRYFIKVCIIPLSVSSVIFLSSQSFTSLKTSSFSHFLALFRFSMDVSKISSNSLSSTVSLRGHPFSKYAKFPKN